MKTQSKPFNIEHRLVRFAGDIILFTRTFSNDDAGRYLRDQITRSSCAAGLNYGETQGAESTKDSLHKLGMVIKELKETRMSLRILDYVKIGDEQVRGYLIGELEELIAIVVTIRKNKSPERSSDS